MGMYRISTKFALIQFAATFIFTTIAITSVAADEANAKPGCQSHCGDISIPFPFGSGKYCNISSDFFIRCNTIFKPPKAFLTTIDVEVEVEVLNIYLDGSLRIQRQIGHDCYNSSGRSSYVDPWIGLSKFSISHTRNKFIAVGCDTYAYIRSNNYSAGCITFCEEIGDVINGSCSGTGCCHTAIPKGLRSYYNLSFSSYNNHSNILSFNPCSYGFFVEDGDYNFSVSDLGVDFGMKKFPVVVDWTIGNQTCIEAKMDQKNYACKENSQCVDSKNGQSGYLCKCLNGFQGNPYLSHGCQDIDECETLKPCNGTCQNLPGSYSCSCPEEFEGDGWKNGTGCTPKIIPQNGQTLRILVLALGLSISLLSALLCSSWVYFGLKLRKFYKKRDFHDGNLKLQQLEKKGVTVRMFTAKELEVATDNYDEGRILGGGVQQGFFYKGLLPDHQFVTIKKSKRGDICQSEEDFVDEIVVLARVSHRNVVKFLGCCLETQVPILVYEYVSGGTLFSYLHEAYYNASTIVVSWEARLEIATQTAQALSYLHSASSQPIIHRDVKSNNILLDENYNAKLWGFDVSQLMTYDQSQRGPVIGTDGYVDPEYMATGRLSEKIDVYSFGVVLIELLTGLRAFRDERLPEEERNLPEYFLSVMKEDRLVEIIDERVLNRKNIIEQLEEVASLARRCVRLKGQERPSMKEVASELELLRAMKIRAWEIDTCFGDNMYYSGPSDGSPTYIATP